jgi:CRISPR-associated protein Csy1
VLGHINDARWSEQAKEAFEAQKKNLPSENGYKTFPDMAVQKFGGAQPQNISQLNLVRGGTTKLLASLPPTWQTVLRPPQRAYSVFPRIFGARPEVQGIVRGLTNFLCRVRAYNNWDIRKARAIIVDKLVDQLVQFTAQFHEELEPGWSDDPKCQLNREEKLWLDPERARSDKNFKYAWYELQWERKVADSFGEWFNEQLRYHSADKGELNVTEVEQREWRKLAEQALTDLMGGEPYAN